MRSNVEALVMFPSESSNRPGPPLLRRLRGATPFPGLSARMRPSDSPAASAPAVVALAVGLPRAERFSEPAARAPGDARRAGGLGSGSAAAPDGLGDRPGPPRLRGPPRPPRRG